MPVACIAPLDPEQCGRWPPYRFGRMDSTGVRVSDKEPSGLCESLRFIVCTVRARTWIGSFFFQPLHPYDPVNACACADMPVSRQGLPPDPPTTAGSKRRSRPVRHRDIDEMAGFSDQRIGRRARTCTSMYNKVPSPGK